MSERREAEVVVVGGGMWGLSTAYHLAQLGVARDVLIVERNEGVLQESSRLSAGLISQWSEDPVLRRAGSYTFDLISRLETPSAIGLVRSGAIHAALSPEHAQHLEEQAQLLNQQGLAVEKIDPSRARELMPNLIFQEVAAAYWAPDDGYVSSTGLGAALVTAVLNAGARIATGLEVTQLLVEDGRVRGVQTPLRTVETSKVIVTAGPWSGWLVDGLGELKTARYPLQLLQLRTSVAPSVVSCPVVRVHDGNWCIRPDQGSYLCNAAELPDRRQILVDQPAQELADPKVVDRFKHDLSRLLPEIEELEVTASRQCMVNTTTDDRLTIGRVPGIHGLWMAAGCTSDVVTLSGAVGRWLARAAIHGHPGDDLSSWSLSEETASG